MRPADNRGFALIIALSLMGFIFLLLLSLGALTRVSIESASQSELQSRAQQNAMAGLYVALGELQRYAGPDQRATATASIASPENELPMPVAGTGNWMGVWGNANNPQQQGEQREPRLLNWLVSGNEGLTLTASTNTSSFGQISAPAGGSWRPTVSPNDATAVGANASATDNFRVGTSDARLLVGPKTAGTGAGAADRYVIAPLVQIDSNSGGASSGVPMENRYAYWIGDESVKARVNLVNPWPVAGGSAATMRRERNYSFGSAQRVAADKITGLSNLPSTALPANTMVGDVVEMQQVGMIQGVSGADVAQRFHDVSAHSRSVLADVRQGGLKRDLTSILRAGGGSSDEADTRFIFPDENDSFSSGDPFYKKPPTWGLLRDFARFESLPALLPLTPQTPTATRQGLAPVVAFVGMYYSWRVLEIVPDPVNPVPVGPTDPKLVLQVAVSPRVFLWNPYNRTLRRQSFEIGIIGPSKQDSESGGGITKGEILFQLTQTDENTGVSQTRDFIFNQGTVTFNMSSPASRTALRFEIEMDDLEPGRTVNFQLPAGTDAPYSPGMKLTQQLLTAYYPYSQDAYVIIAEQGIEVDGNLADFEFRLNATFHARNIGELNAYLAELGANPSPSTAISPGNSNRIYQWIGRVEASHEPIPETGSLPAGARNTTFTADVPMGTTADPDSPYAVTHYEMFHKLGITGAFTPTLPVRWIAAGNIRAYMNNRTGMEFGGVDQMVVNPLYSAYAGGTLSGSSGGRAVPMGNVYKHGGVYAGLGNDYNNSSYADTANDRRPKLALFELPSDESPIMSIADLRHAALASHSTAPTYGIGNSIADYRVGLDDLNVDVNSGYIQSGFSASDYGPLQQTLFDHSYMLNNALWDRYFFSTIPAASTPEASLPNSLPNARHTILERNGELPTLAELNADAQGLEQAGHMLLEGGFNVNSTSVEAWKAVLAGLDGLSYDPTNPTRTGAPALQNPFSRFRNTLARSGRPGTGSTGTSNMPDYWGGYRELTADELDGLARRIVQQVKERGPFVSVADFVNRSLTGPDLHKLKGAIQAAIDDEAAGINNSSRINFIAEGTTPTGAGRHLNRWHVEGGPAKYGYPDGWSSAYDAKAFVGWNSTNRSQINNPFTRSAAFAPGEVTQSDVLAAIGSSLTVRSDTFVIRSYGEVIDPVSSRVVGRAWCEAVVQRMPDYVDDVDSPEVAPASLVSGNNQLFGRRFVVTSFRWLNAEDI